MKYFVLYCLCFLAVGAVAQDGSDWKRDDKIDTFRGSSYTMYSLEGKFLTPPSHSSLDQPRIVVQCVPGPDHQGHTHGKFISGYVAIGTVVDATAENAASRVRIQFRLNDGKIQERPWTPSTDFLAIYMKRPSGINGSGYEEFANLLYGHEMYHKENTNAQTQKIVIDIPEYLGGEVVMQFDLPDSTGVADACGIIWHK